MTTLENIKKICREKKKISITTLEQELGYSNGSLSKAKDIPSSRILEISNYLGVSMEYLMTGETPDGEYTEEDFELLELFSTFNKEQKTAIFNMMRSFALWFNNFFL